MRSENVCAVYASEKKVAMKSSWMDDVAEMSPAL